ncbi:ATP-binding cassette domain-containing protein [Agromyces sp. SYSU K20354]|uniref:ribosomal protection-like ABC-F family protein n=1 Tax=Agromyces cavernae TaxID=2898659 RepID=UPI001E5B4118|nr:ABC-F family ATP-binding cassette domain-containing protein [Agromyces cavernae]MCD2443020.1 ATP-binding cassette domain-containing protein [Agromyces cavernae]
MYPSTSQLSLHAVTKRFADRLVLDRVDLTVRPGERVGIIGDNGSGKSTLLRLIARDLEPDNGDVRVVAPGGVGYLAQQVELATSATVDDAIGAGLADLRALEADLAAAERALAGLDGDALAAALGRYGELVDRFTARDGYAADARLEVALDALGVGGIERGRPWANLSGGERSRIALAATLAADPELLLLDEPTNDLDDAAWEWLRARLHAHRGTVVAVTHDRAFLDELTDVVWEVDDRGVSRHGDGYAGYLVAKATQRREAIEAYETWKAELARNRDLVAANASRLDAIPRKLDKPGMGTGAFRARGRDHGAMGRIRNAKERIARLTEHAVAPPPEPLTFTAPLGGERDETDVPGAAIALDDVRVGDRLAVDHLHVEPGERVLITGPNGAGKTTLLRLIAHEAAPDAGTVLAPPRVGHLRQASAIAPTDETVVEGFAHRTLVDLDTSEQTLGSLGLFRPDDLSMPLHALSYGQRRRLELAVLVTGGHDVLLLDEPTNHLAPALVEDLERALASFPGTVLLVTHDRLMRARFAGRRLHLEAGALVEPAGR